MGKCLSKPTDNHKRNQRHNENVIAPQRGPTECWRNVENEEEVEKKTHRQKTEKELLRLQKTIRDRNDVISKHEAKIQELEEQNRELLTRLSALASAKLTDGNANIADLSDENRPTKLAEQFSELYDNEWTDALEKLSQSNTRTEEEACIILLRIICDAYKICTDEAEKEYAGLVNGMTPFSGKEDIPRDILKHFKDARKKKKTRHQRTPHEKAFKKTLCNGLKDKLQDRKERNSNELKAFVKKCIQLCWYMAIQDPPVYMDTDINRSGELFNKNTHKPYTVSGTFIAFIVWPSLYLCKDGNLLSKGIAQCKNSCETEQIETERIAGQDDQPVMDNGNVYIKNAKATSIQNREINDSDNELNSNAECSPRNSELTPNEENQIQNETKTNNEQCPFKPSLSSVEQAYR